MATEGNDIINGTTGNDLIDGLGGDDAITGALGRDTISGGAGNDRFVIRGRDDLEAGESYAGGDGWDTLFVGQSGVTLSAVAIAADVENLICKHTEYSDRYSIRMTARQLGAFRQIDSGEIVVTQAGLADLRGDWYASKSIWLQAADVTLILSDNVYGAKVTGSEGRDKVTGGSQLDSLKGNGGDDVLAGGGGDDWIRGGAGADIVNGGAGDDVFYTDSADLAAGDRIAGGEGADELFIASMGGDRVRLDGSVLFGSVERLAAHTAVDIDAAILGRFDYVTGDEIKVVTTGLVDLRGAWLDSAAITLAAEGITFTMAGTNSEAEIDGSEWRDVVTGGNYGDRISGHAGDDVIRGGGGADELSGGIGADLIQGGDNDDTISVGSRSELSEGDRFSGGAGRDTLDAADGTNLGNAFVSGDIERLVGDNLELTARQLAAFQEIHSAHVTITTPGIVDFSGMEFCPGAITLAVGGVTLKLASRSPDGFRVEGSEGADVIRDYVGSVIHGNGGDDYLDLNYGYYHAAGGSGDDTYHLHDWEAEVVELAGEGTDTILTEGASITLDNHFENLTYVGGGVFRAFGNGSDNRIEGGSGADTIEGRAGNDALHGGDGRDQLTGGAGADRFVFDTALSPLRNTDSILDFGADDLIALDRTIFAALPGRGAGLALDAFVAGTRAQDAEDRIVYDQASGKLYYDADGSGAGVKLLFAQVDAGTAISAADFQLFG